MTAEENSEHNNDAIVKTSLHAWYEQLANGLGTIVVATFIEFSLNGIESRHGGPEWLWLVIGLLPVAFEVGGYWMVTTPSPESFVPRPDERSRLVTRWLGVVIAVASVADTAGILLGWWSWEALTIYLLLVMALQLGVFAIYLGSLARCVGRPRFVWPSYLALGGLSLGLFGFSACLPFIENLEKLDFSVPTLVILVASLLIMLIFGITTVVVLWRFRNALTKITEASNATVHDE